MPIMKRIFICCTLPLLAAACGRNGDFDATGTFEATEVVVSAEAAGRILRFDAEEGDGQRQPHIRIYNTSRTATVYLRKK